LDDLIVGSAKAEARAGKSYGIFGKTDGTVINLLRLIYRLHRHEKHQ
jgi:hypothetical protein